MNWFTESYVLGNSLKHKTELVEEWGGCEHVEKDPSLLVVVKYENDPWGREGYCLCEQCSEESDKAEDEIEEICYDCGGVFKRKDTISWKWYDFYAPQGDEPLIICNDCRKKDKHIQRIVKDRIDRDNEFDDLTEDDCDNI